MTVLKMLGYFMTFNCYLRLPKNIILTYAKIFLDTKGIKNVRQLLKPTSN